MPQKPAIWPPRTPASDALILANVDLAREIAGYMRLGGQVDRAAVESDAMLGLLYAARTFDAKRGAAFGTWLSQCIKSRVKDGHRNRYQKRQAKLEPLQPWLSSPDESAAAAVDRTDEVLKILQRMSPGMADLLRQRYLIDGGSLQPEIAAKAGVCKAMISKRLTNALAVARAVGTPK